MSVGLSDDDGDGDGDGDEPRIYSTKSDLDDGSEPMGADTVIDMDERGDEGSDESNDDTEAALGDAGGCGAEVDSGTSGNANEVGEELRVAAACGVEGVAGRVAVVPVELTTIGLALAPVEVGSGMTAGLAPPGNGNAEYHAWTPSRNASN